MFIQCVQSPHRWTNLREKEHYKIHEVTVDRHESCGEYNLPFILVKLVEHHWFRIILVSGWNWCTVICIPLYFSVKSRCQPRLHYSGSGHLANNTRPLDGINLKAGPMWIELDQLGNLTNTCRPWWHFDDAHSRPLVTATLVQGLRYGPSVDTWRKSWGGSPVGQSTGPCHQEGQS